MMVSNNAMFIDTTSDNIAAASTSLDMSSVALDMA